MVSATASLVPGEILSPRESPASAAQNESKLSAEGQVESDSRYQQIIALYGARFSEDQKAKLKKMSDELQPTLEHVRGFHLENGNAPALYLKPLVEREKKPQSAPPSQPGATSKKA